MYTSIAILGATGVVGQKVIALLANNPRFNIIELVASDQRIGQAFGEACDWREPIMPLPEKISKIKLSSDQDLKADFIVSCLPSDIAEVLEPALAKQGKIVFSNASAFRMHENIPLLVPEINFDHLSLLRKQKTKGKIITNPNCSAVGVTIALAPLMRLGEIEHVSVVTLQSISGAGYPGVPSLDILGNTIPYISSEAEKITEETKRILGTAENYAEFSITTHVHRVPVMYGHTVTMHVMFKESVRSEQAIESYLAWNKKYSELFLIHNKSGRPQSTKDLAHNDMRAHIGHLRQGDKPNIIGLVCLTHNLVRGAAGAVVANIESYLNFREGIQHYGS
ncbi:MAG: aspartate-semialdehyde dehydrogenase [Candidatus Midichloria sp.]|nr:MAG: aspartate-semialdehyde dehydrogenase [Candidatus Midichloria sp.]